MRRVSTYNKRSLLGTISASPENFGEVNLLVEHDEGCYRQLLESAWTTDVKMVVFTYSQVA